MIPPFREVERGVPADTRRRARDEYRFRSFHGRLALAQNERSFLSLMEQSPRRSALERLKCLLVLTSNRLPDALLGVGDNLWTELQETRGARFQHPRQRTVGKGAEEVGGVRLELHGRLERFDHRPRRR